MGKNWDFSGWATKAGIKCSDGRTILPGAFSANDGMKVPLVWNHQHNDPSEVLGHAVLENRDDGVYAYCSFNNNPKAREAKELVKHGDVKALSIYANQLVQSKQTPPCDVIHGNIREVSLVLAGANIGAFIDNIAVHGDTDLSSGVIYHGDIDGDFFINDDAFYHANRDDEDEDDEDEYEDEDTDDTEEVDEDEEDEEDDEEETKAALNSLNKKQKAAVGKVLTAQEKRIRHADEEENEDETIEDVFNTLSEKQKKVVYAMIGMALQENGNGQMKHADDEEENEDETIEDVFNTLSEKQKKVVYAMIGLVLQENENGKGQMKHADGADDEDDEDGDETLGEIIETLTPKQRKAVDALVGLAISENNSNEENNKMKHNVFESYDEAPIVSYEEQKSILAHCADTKQSSLKGYLRAEAKRDGSVLAHAITDHNGNSITYGIANIDYLFPDAQAINNTPELISKNQDWVNKVMNGTHHTPFARVKSLFADITGEDARARGYVKGNQKVDEVIEVLKRETYPQTVYKKQRLDTDDIDEITSFDVVAWLKGEMQIMLKAEIARAILIGDGRSAGTDKIKENCIRPIYNDDDLFTVKVPVAAAANATDDEIASGIIDATIRSRRQYKGSGNPSMFIDEKWLDEMLLLKDGMGRRLYETEASLAAALRVKELIPVDVMDNQEIAIKTGVGNATADKPLVCVIVNLQDYNIGANHGGKTNFFDDFDIDYNQQIYLYETRLSGALIKPYSAMSIYIDRAS